MVKMNTLKIATHTNYEGDTTHCSKQQTLKHLSLTIDNYHVLNTESNH